MDKSRVREQEKDRMRDLKVKERKGRMGEGRGVRKGKKKGREEG